MEKQIDVFCIMKTSQISNHATKREILKVFSTMIEAKNYIDTYK